MPLNLSSLKNLLPGLTPPAQSEPPSPSPVADTIAAQVSKKQKELAQGKTAAQVERLRADLDDALLAREQAETAEGECLVDGRDPSEATAARHQAADRVRVLESALKIAIQKDGAALADLQQAESDLVTAAKEEAIEAMMELAVQTQLSFSRVKQQRLEVDRQLKNLVMVGALTQRAVSEIIDQYDFYVKIATRSPAADQADSGAYRKYRGWFHCVAYLCDRAEP